jgi:predicted house-cleaning noncanonical NTP pyrophosphatase (MazG superfamily)
MGMKKIYYNKLIRDKIPDRIKKKGGDFEIRKLSAAEFEKELLKKVGEEAGGLLNAKTKKELTSEIADILAVIREIQKVKRIPDKYIEKALQENFTRKGGFEKKLFLVWSSDTGYKTNERRYGKRAQITSTN